LETRRHGDNDDSNSSSKNSHSLASRESLRKQPEGRIAIEFETIKEELPGKHFRGESFINKNDTHKDEFGSAEKRFHSVKSPFLRE